MEIITVEHIRLTEEEKKILDEAYLLLVAIQEKTTTPYLKKLVNEAIDKIVGIDECYE